MSKPSNRTTRPLTLGLTGSIGSGKTTVANMLLKLGAIVVDSDEISHQLTANPGHAVEQLADVFGESIIIAKNGSLDRRALAKIVFADPTKLRELERIVHPLIRKAFLEQINSAVKKNPPLVVGVVPLLFESIYRYEEFDKIAVISCPIETTVTRVMTRSGMTREEVLTRYNQQLSVEEKKRRADIFIENDDTEEALERKVKELFAKLTVQ